MKKVSENNQNLKSLKPHQNKPKKQKNRKKKTWK